MFSLSAGRALAQPSLPSSQAGPSAHSARALLPVPCRLPPLSRTRNTKAAGLEHEGVRPVLSISCILLRLASANAPMYSSSVQDFGARDPYEAEVKSNFANKVLGNADTSHVIRRAALHLPHTPMRLAPLGMLCSASRRDNAAYTARLKQECFQPLMNFIIVAELQCLLLRLTSKAPCHQGPRGNGQAGWPGRQALRAVRGWQGAGAVGAGRQPAPQSGALAPAMLCEASHP